MSTPPLHPGSAAAGLLPQRLRDRFRGDGDVSPGCCPLDGAARTRLQLVAARCSREDGTAVAAAMVKTTAPGSSIQTIVLGVQLVIFSLSSYHALFRIITRTCVQPLACCRNL